MDFVNKKYPTGRRYTSGEHELQSLCNGLDLSAERVYLERDKRARFTIVVKSTGEVIKYAGTTTECKTEIRLHVAKSKPAFDRAVILKVIDHIRSDIEDLTKLL